MQKGTLKEQLTQQLSELILNSLELKKALIGIAPYTEGDVINIEKEGELIHGIVERVTISTSPYLSYVFEDNGRVSSVRPYYSFIIRLFKKNGDLGVRITHYTTPIMGYTNKGI